jgi:hypothetical protein
VAPAGVDRLPVDEAVDQVSGRSTALRSQPGLLAQVGLCCLRGDDVHRIHGGACEREAGFSGDSKARGFIGAHVPIGEQRDAVGMNEHLEADPLMHAPRRQVAQEPNIPRGVPSSPRRTFA